VELIPQLKHNELILDYIGPIELTNYLNYLSERQNAEQNMDRILETILYEFKREYYVG